MNCGRRRVAIKQINKCVVLLMSFCRLDYAIYIDSTEISLFELCCFVAVESVCYLLKISFFLRELHSNLYVKKQENITSLNRKKNTTKKKNEAENDIHKNNIESSKS